MDNFCKQNLQDYVIDVTLYSKNYFVTREQITFELQTIFTLGKKITKRLQ